MFIKRIIILLNIILFINFAESQLKKCSNSQYCTCHQSSVSCADKSLTEIPDVSSDTKILYLHGNKFSIIKTGAFQSLKILRSLYLSDNNIKTLEDRAFEGLSNLEELQLYKNEIEFIHFGAFSGLYRLRFLYLNLNKIFKIETRTFSNLIALQKLYLNNNKLTTLQEGTFSESNPLDTLRLQNNHLDCDCDLLWLWEYFENQKSRLKLSYNPLVGNCSKPLRLYNRRLITLSKSDFDCQAPLILTKPNDYEIDTNQLKSFRTDCIASGNPKPLISWNKGNLRLQSTERLKILEDGTLVINDISETDFGEYECIARNRMGDSRVFIRIKEKLKLSPTNNQVDQNNEFIFEEYQEENDYDNFFGKEIISTSSLRFTELPIDQITNEGASIEFRCRVGNTYYHQISWTRNGEEIKSGNRVFIHSNGDLIIHPVRVSDEGFYVCVISDGREEKYAQAQLIINVPPTFLQKPVDLEVIEGTIAEFNCLVSGKPKPMIKWTKNGRSFSKSNSTLQSNTQFSMGNQILRIYSANRTTDAGLYSCTAENSVSKISANARLNVKPGRKPFFELRRLQTDQTVYEYQEDLTLLCKPEGIPKPQVFWYKDGFRVITDSRVYFDPFGTFKINEVRAEDSGEYTCKAKNSAGEILHKFTLTVIDLHSKIITNDVINDAIRTAKGDVNKQYVDTRKNLHDRRKPKTSSDLLQLLRFPKEKTLLITIGEEVYERALELIYKHALNVSYNLTKKDFKIDEIITHRQLQRIADLSGCHRHKRKVNCSQRCLNYRTSDGTCNNLGNSHLGGANTPLRRLLPAEYENKFATPKGWTNSILHNGYSLPSARSVSTKIISTKKITEDSKFSLMLMQWGQFFDHDLDHTVSAGSLNRFSNGLACKDSCTNEQPCYPIEIDKNDPHRHHHPDMCMEFIRSSAVCGTGETSLITNQVLQREQINQVTSYIDGSNVYGSNDQDAFDIRERIANNGQLKVHVTSKYQKGVLPFNLDTPIDCQRDNQSLIGCFLAGDYRVNEQLALLAMHNVWVRQHNRLAAKLQEINPNWTSEQIYQEARKIVGAQMQVITFEHWLPYIFGPIGMRRLGEYKGYNADVDASISNEFATAAFRFGHALIQPFTFRLNESYQPISEGHLLLRDSFFSPQRFYHEGGQDPLVRGVFGMPAKLKMPREIMNSELTEKLFHITRSISQDLAAINIQRSRDHGLPGYAEYRKHCKMPEAKSFEDLKKDISSAEVRKILKDLYGDVRNIDLWPGGILEDVLPESKLGPLFMCIISDQMKALRDGDRFWYENPGVFTPRQVEELKKTTLAKILCETGDNIEYIQRDVFLNAKYPDQMVKCSEISDIILEEWKDCCKDSATGLCSEPSIYNTNTETSKYSKRGTNSFQKGKKCNEDNKSYYDEERWLRSKCTECICLDGSVTCVKLSTGQC